MKTLFLNKNTSIPIIGFGTWRLNGEECIRAVLKALEVGYRHIDTADMYGNHKEVAKAITKSGLKRKDIFITTKIPPSDLHKEKVLSNCDRYLEELNISYIDLLLIHWPNYNIPIEETLSAMSLLKQDGKIKAIGVANFTIHHLEDASNTNVEISNNQVELHPKFNQKKLKKFCDSYNVVITAYSPLGKGTELKSLDPLILTLSKKYKVSVSQVILNWIMQRKVVAIPKSSRPERIEDNFNSTKWKMDELDVEKMNNIQQENRLVNPDFSEFDY